MTTATPEKTHQATRDSWERFNRDRRYGYGGSRYPGLRNLEPPHRSKHAGGHEQVKIGLPGSTGAKRILGRLGPPEKYVRAQNRNSAVWRRQLKAIENQKATHDDAAS